ncbi:MAG: 5-formyltetrahydrofolate cyclo-ligase [Candidatus Latescibacterota bacterium]|jgi:5-formyltetrahydrofolate cyclo-ligase
MSAPPPSIPDRKQVLRQECRAVRKNLSSEASAQAGRTIQEQVLDLPEYGRSRLVHTYLASRDNEVNTFEVIDHALAHGRRVAVPVVKPGTRRLRHALVKTLADWQPDRWGLLSPPADHAAWLEDLAAIDLVLVPGLAFDPRGRRLGFGGGYYDRFLGKLRAVKVGITYRCLLLPEVPEEPHDVRMDLVVTEAGTWRPPAS